MGFSKTKSKDKTARPIFDLSQAREKIENGKCARWWRRKGSKSGNFTYFDTEGKQISNQKDLERIKSLVIPPAWKSVRISPVAGKKVQALGIDKSGRIQYIYHPKFTEQQKRKKFQKIARFGTYLPKLRKITNEHILLEGFPREKVLAVMLRLINSLYIRIGSENSVKYYKTYGITTLRNRHLEIGKNGQLIFSFVGKHHIKHRQILVDKELAVIMRDLKSLGKTGKLFHYLNDANQPQPVRPAEINEYLKTITAPEFSVKDFRTWGATLLAARELAKLGAASEEPVIKKNLVKAVKQVARQLGNTPTVCRNSYIHPFVLEAYQKGLTLENFVASKRRLINRTEKIHQPEEEALLKLLDLNN
jgi:DNA topoisomerase I